MTDQTPATPETAETAWAHVSALWAGDATSQLLGLQLLSVGPGTAELWMRVRADMVNGYDLCHGGVIASLADSAFGLACNSHGPMVVGAGFEITFLEPARVGEELVATARETARRGRSGLYDVSVRRREDDVVVAEFRGRSRRLAHF